MTTHSDIPPLPWTCEEHKFDDEPLPSCSVYDANGLALLTDVTRIEIASFIVRACNTRDELIAAAKESLVLLRGIPQSHITNQIDMVLRSAIAKSA